MLHPQGCICDSRVEFVKRSGKGKGEGGPASSVVETEFESRGERNNPGVTAIDNGGLRRKLEKFSEGLKNRASAKGGAPQKRGKTATKVLNRNYENIGTRGGDVQGTRRAYKSEERRDE